MLGTFRDKILSWGAKILFALLIVSFMLWGVGDYIGPATQADEVAAVGSVKISGYDLQDQVQTSTRRLSAALGQPITNEQARAFGIVDQTLETMVQRALFQESANQLGLLVKPEMAAREIRDDARFKSATGQFNRNIFDQAVSQMGLNEALFLQRYQRDILRGQMLSVLNMSNKAPRTLTETLYRYRNEKRIAEMIRIDHSSMVNLPTATQAQLKTFHKENARQFTAPEYRTVTMVRMKPETVAETIDVTEEKIKEEYENRINEFSQPERRKLQQILVSDEAKAKAIASRLATGEDFTKIALEEASLKPADLELGTLSKQELPLPELADAAFQVAAGATSQPVKTALGYHIVKVLEVTPSSRKTLVEVRKQIKDEIALSLAIDSLYNIANKFEDDLGAGATIQEAAEKLNFKAVTINKIDAQGLDDTGSAVADVDQNPNIVRLIFDTEEGQESPLTDLDQAGFVIVKVTGVTPPTLRPFESVRSQVEAAWRSDQQALAAEKLSAALLDELKGGKPISQIAQDRGAEIMTTPAFTRNGAGLTENLPGQLITYLFTLKSGEYTSVAGNGLHYLARLKDIVGAQPVAEADAMDGLSRQLGQALVNDLTIQMANALQTKMGVTINRAAVDSLFGGGDAAGQPVPQ